MKGRIIENYVIIGIILLISGIAIGTLIKRKGRRGCFGSGSDYETRKN